MNQMSKVPRSAASPGALEKQRKSGTYPAMISMNQLAVLLCVCRLPVILLGLLGDGMEQVWSVLLAELIRILLCLPLCLAFGRGWALGDRQSGFWVGIFRVLAVFYLLISLGALLAGTGIFVSSTLYPGSSAFFFGAALLLLAAYGAHMGLEAAARTALPVLVAFALGMLLTALGVRQEIRLIHLRPAEDFSALLKSSLSMAGQLPEWLVLLTAGPQSEGKGGKAPAVCWAFGLSALFTGLASFLCGAVLGGLQRQAAYPFFKVETLMKLSVFQRMDAWFLALWLLVLFVRCLFLLWAAEQLLSPFVPKRRKLLLPVLAAVSLAVCGAILRQDGLAAILRRTGECIWWIPLLLLLLIVVWLGGGGKGWERRKRS